MRASPFEGTHKKYNSSGCRGGRENRFSSSILDGCDILKYTSSSDSKMSAEQISSSIILPTNGNNIKPSSVDRLSTTMKCSLGKINLNN